VQAAVSFWDFCLQAQPSTFSTRSMLVDQVVVVVAGAWVGRTLLCVVLEEVTVVRLRMMVGVLKAVVVL
jgi:hypothetical protein